MSSKKMVWDQVGEKLYHTGIEQTALYPQDETGAYPHGVAWSGVSNITDTPSGGEPNDTYADNQKYLTLMSREEFGGSITAYMSPPEFDECDGSIQAVQGLRIRQQTRRAFGLAYKSLVGNDTEDTDYGYDLHLVWGAKASPSEEAHDTVNDSPEATELSWEFSCTPVRVTTKIKGKVPKPFAHMVISSKASKIADLEKILYGDENTEPRLPLPDEVLEIMCRNESADPMPTEHVISELGSKNVSDLIGDDIKIDESGAVTGTLKYVTGWTAFSSNQAEQSGNFFPIKLNSKYEGKEITCVGSSTKKSHDLEWVLRVKDKNATFKFSAEEDSEFLTLSFKEATLQSS